MIGRFRTRRFAALISPAEICLLEYAMEKGGVSLVARWSETGSFDEIGDATDRLAVMISAQGAGRASIAIAVDHFGGFHHLLSLPAAPREVLRPIVERELQRTFGVNRVTVDFTIGQGDDGARLPQASAKRVIAIGAPTEVVTAIRDRLAASKVRVERITVIGQAVDDAYRAVDRNTSKTTCVVVCTAAGPYVCFFLEGELVLTIDVPPQSDDAPNDDLTVVHQVEQGAVYFRQQFRGARPDRLLIACDSRRMQALSASLREAIGVPVEALGDEIGDGPSVVAFGAAIGATHAESLELLAELSPRDRARVRATGRSRASATASTGSILVIAAWCIALISIVWAGHSVYALRKSRMEIVTLQGQLKAAQPVLGPAIEAARNRATHQSGAQIVADVRAERVTLARALTGLERARPEGVLFDSLTTTHGADGVTISLTGRASGFGAVALGRILTLQHNIEGQIGVDASPDVSDAALDGSAEFTRFAFSFLMPSARK